MILRVVRPETSTFLIPAAGGSTRRPAVSPGGRAVRAPAPHR